jgi:hypothetical protein
MRTIDQHQGILHDCLILPTQWNCYHLSCEQLLGTPEIVENHETMGNNMHFHEDPLGHKTVHIFSWNWTHKITVTLVCASRRLQGLNIHSKNQWIPNWTRKITHTHTHTHTYTKCWYNIRYLLSKFLNIHLLNYDVWQTRSHWTAGHSGALHQFPQSKW